MLMYLDTTNSNSLKKELFNLLNIPITVKLAHEYH